MELTGQLMPRNTIGVLIVTETTDDEGRLCADVAWQRSPLHDAPKIGPTELAYVLRLAADRIAPEISADDEF